jgi:hypothetical protein
MAFSKYRRICVNEIGEIRMGRTRSASEGEQNAYFPSPENPETTLGRPGQRFVNITKIDLIMLEIQN